MSVHFYIFLSIFYITNISRLIHKGSVLSPIWGLSTDGRKRGRENGHRPDTAETSAEPEAKRSRGAGGFGICGHAGYASDSSIDVVWICLV